MRRTCALTLCLFLAVVTAGMGEEDGKLTCTGRVVDSTGAPIEGASVAAYEGISHVPLPVFELRLMGRKTTPPDGTFVFTQSLDVDWMPTGAMIVVEKSGFALGWANWMLNYDTEVTIELGAATTMAGRVVDEAGKPVEGAEVRALLAMPGTGQGVWGFSPINQLATETDSEGRFSFSNIPTGASADFYIAGAGRAGFLTSPDMQECGTQFRAGQTDIEIVMPVGAVIEGIVVDKKTRKPVPRVDLIAGWMNLIMPLGAFSAVSGDDGKFRMAVKQAPSYAVFLLSSKEAFPDWVAEPVMATLTQEGKTLRPVTIEVQRGGILEVAVTDESNNRPIENARVGGFGGEDIVHWVRGSTARDGIARFRLLPATYELDVYAHDYEPFNLEESVTVEEGKTHRLDVRLSPRPGSKEAGGDR